VSLGYYKNLVINDTYPLAVFNNKLMLFWQDFVAPFHLFMKAGYKMNYLKMEEDFTNSKISLVSEADMRVSGKTREKIGFSFRIDDARISMFEVKGVDITISAKEIRS
jgi:hypothetical protein